MLSKKRAEDCTRQFGSCKATGGAYERHAICIKDWVCFDTSADHFWTLTSFVMCEALAYDLAEGSHKQCGLHDAEPIREQCDFYENT